MIVENKKSKGKTYLFYKILTITQIIGYLLLLLALIKYNKDMFIAAELVIILSILVFIMLIKNKDYIQSIKKNICVKIKVNKNDSKSINKVIIISILKLSIEPVLLIYEKIREIFSINN